MSEPGDANRQAGSAGQDLSKRTLEFGVRIIRLCTALPNTAVGRVIQDQLLRSGTSVGAQYREANRAKSKADFISKLGGVLQELDETAYWLELLVAAEVMTESRLESIRQEVHELISVFTAISKSAKRNSPRPKR